LDEKCDVLPIAVLRATGCDSATLGVVGFALLLAASLAVWL